MTRSVERACEARRFQDLYDRKGPGRNVPQRLVNKFAGSPYSIHPGSFVSLRNARLQSQCDCSIAAWRIWFEQTLSNGGDGM
jgi:hypothetical protein